MGKQILTCLLFSYFCFSKIIAQTGTIKGNVKTADDKAVQYVTIKLKPSTKGTITDENGNFTFDNVEASIYAVTASFTGYKNVEKKISVNPNETVVVNFILSEATDSLQTVEVTGRKQTSYKNDNSFSAAKIEMQIKDIPQSISSVTKELIEDKQAMRLNEVVQNVAGINQFSNYDDITMRGFRNAGSDGRLINGLRTINQYGTSPLLVNIERVEFIKGPASAVFSNTNPGGTINMITKKPLDIARQSVEFGTGSFNTLRALADVTGPLDKDKILLYRMNFGVENADTYRTNILNNSFTIAPSISFLPREGTRFNADFVYLKQNSQFDEGRPIVNGSKDVLALPMKLTSVQPNDYDYLEQMNLTLSFSQTITKNLSFNISYLKVKSTEKSAEHSVDQYITPDSMSLAYGVANTTQSGNNVTTYLTFKTKTGSIEHTLLGGYDYIDGHFLQYYKTAYDTADGVVNFSLINPLYSIQPVENYKYESANIQNYGSDYYTNGVYIQDLIKYRRLQLLLSLRQEFYTYPKSEDLSVQGTLAEKQSEKALLPRIGAAYSVTKNVNVYATYVTGFESQDSYSISAPGAGGPFDPLTSSLIEAGAKGEFFKNCLFGSAAVYQIIQNHVLVSANDPAHPNLLLERGQERSRGVELEAGGAVSSNLSIQLSYAYNRAIITKSTPGDPDKQIGLTKEGAPKNVSGSWIKYSVRNGSLKGLGFAAGHSQVGKKETYDRTLVIPGYLIFNGGMYYKIDRFQISANVNNFTNKKYLVGGFSYYRTFPGAPRNYMVSVGYAF